MSATIKEYHRTFLHYPSRKGPSVDEYLHRLGHPGTPPVRQPIKPQGDIRDRYVGVSMVKSTPRYHKAIEIFGTNAREITLEEKGDQNFETWATPWERAWSPLTRNERNGIRALVPVVDGNATVVGYAGEVLSSELLIGRATWLALVYTAEETLQYHRMFVGSRALHAAVPDLETYGTGLNYYSVMTDIYGEITSFRLAYPSTNGSAQSTGLPGLAWLRIIQGGLKILFSVKNGSRTVTRPAPDQAPKMQNSLPSGKTTHPPPPPPSGRGGTMADSQSSLPPQVPHVKTSFGEAIATVRKHLGLPPLPASKTMGELRAKARGDRADIEIHDWVTANPNASWPEKLQKMLDTHRKWGLKGFPGDDLWGRPPHIKLPPKTD